MWLCGDGPLLQSQWAKLRNDRGAKGGQVGIEDRSVSNHHLPVLFRGPEISEVGGTRWKGDKREDAGLESTNEMVRVRL